jgi:hypothetical protein
MMPPSRKAAILTDYVFGVGLRLSLQLEELFKIEGRPIIEAAGKRRILLTGGLQRAVEDLQMAPVKKRAISMLVRQLRSFEFIAVGGTEILGEVGPLALIVPRRWDSLTVTWGSDTVTDDLAVIHDVHVAKVDRLGEAQRRELDELLYTLSKQRVGDIKESGKEGGRPARQREMVEAWISERKASERGMPEKEEAARSQAQKHFEAEIEQKQISMETIRTTIKAFYTTQK